MPFTKESSKKVLYDTWRKRRGIKLVVSIKPVGKLHRATAMFEGKEYRVAAKTNIEALNSLFELLKPKI